MRLIKRRAVADFADEHPDARASLDHWADVAEAATWNKLQDVRQSFNSADEAKVESGKTVVIFNINGNRYRLITAIHYNAAKVFVMRFMTHADYSKDRWKDEL